MNHWVWSRGLEHWEPILLSEDEREELRYLYSKTMFGERVNIYLDPLGRYICDRSL